MDLSLYLGNITAQNIILIITALLTYILYGRNRAISLRNAAKLVALQIKDIEKNIEYLKIKCIAQDGTINEQDIFNSSIIFEQNFWDIYKHQLFNYLSSNDYELISNFYKIASMIKWLQGDIKNFILFSLQNTASFREQVLLFELNKLSAIPYISWDTNHLESLIKTKREIREKIFHGSYVPKHYGDYMTTYLSAYNPISGTLAYGTLIKLSKKYFIF